MTEAQSCHLAAVPSHAVVSRKDKADFVRRMLFNQQVWEFNPHPPNERSGPLQSCTDTLQRNPVPFLPGQWASLLEEPQMSNLDLSVYCPPIPGKGW